jgi:3'(2'), 5'-bisphosphate nucleotidase
MMSILTTDENNAILATLLNSGQRAREAAAGHFDVFEKGVEDYVTTVDRELDRELAAAFACQFPQDGIVTEENQSSALRYGADYSRLWFIDPIDGTEDFIHRGQHYSIMVGLLTEHQPTAGWIYAPARHKLYWGGRDWGLFQQDASGVIGPLVPQPQRLGDNDKLIVGDRDQRRFGQAIAAQMPEFRFVSIGSFGLKVLEVILGRAGLYVYFNGRVKLWDTVGPMALARAAGLVCCDLSGRPITFGVNSVFPQTLVHRQPLLIGWPDYVERFRPALRQAVLTVRQQELCLEP